MRLLLATIIGWFGSVAICAAIGVTWGVGLTLGNEGTGDFVQYWSAWQLLRRGMNPYDGKLLNAVQSSIGQLPGVTVMMWNPPWVPVLFAPLLELPFQVSALTWFVSNLWLLLMIALFTPLALGYSNIPMWVYCVGVCFLPLIDCLQLGQLSLTYTAGFVLFLYCIRCERHLLAGAFVSLLMSKPHLFFLCVIPGILWMLRLSARQALLFLLGVCVVSGPLFAITLAYCPEALIWWIEGMANPTNGYGVVAVREWKTATLATFIRMAVGSFTGHVPDWPLLVVPLSGLVATTIYFGVVYCNLSYMNLSNFNLRKRPIVWEHIAPALLCWSSLLSVYGWFFDQAIMVIAHFSLLCRATVIGDFKQRTLAIVGVALIQAVIIGIAAGSTSAQHYYAWVPAAYLALLWYWSGRSQYFSSLLKLACTYRLRRG